jgi:hypothetical protein
MSEISGINNTSLAQLAAAGTDASEGAGSIRGAALTAETSDSGAAADASFYTDTVDISDEARTLALTSAADGSGDASVATASVTGTQSSSEATTGSDAENSAKPAGAPPGRPASSSAASSSETSSSGTNDLSTYTEYQLQEMVKSGTITQVQYNAEISRRESAATQSETN